MTISLLLFPNLQPSLKGVQPGLATFVKLEVLFLVKSFKPRLWKVVIVSPLTSAVERVARTCVRGRVVWQRSLRPTWSSVPRAFVLAGEIAKGKIPGSHQNLPRNGGARKEKVYLESWCKHKKCFSYGVRHSIPTLRICCAKLRKAGFQKDGGRLDLGFVLFDFLYLFLLAFEKYVVPSRTVPSFRNHSVSDTSPL